MASAGLPSDEECVARLQAGGSARADAVATLYRRHAGRLLGYFMRQRVSREQAEDLVQDVFVNMVRHCDGFRGDAKVTTWMWSIARNALIDHVRRVRNAPETDPLGDEDGERPEPPAPDPASKDLDDCVRKAYAEFAAAHPERAETLALVAFEGWSLLDLARVLGRTHGAAREYVSQCRQKLRPFLDRCREFLMA